MGPLPVELADVVYEALVKATCPMQSERGVVVSFAGLLAYRVDLTR
jgi:hypothetical protein